MKEKEAKENQGVRDASQIYRVLAGDVRDTDPISHIRPIFPGLGRGLDLLLPSFLLSREEKKVPAGLCLSPVEAICGAYAIRPYIGGFAHRPHPPHLSPIGAIWGAYAIRPYKREWRFVFPSPFLSLTKEKEAKENQGVRDASQIYRVLAGDVRDTDPISHIRPIFPGLGRGLDLLLPSFLLSREEKKVPAGLRLSPAGAICGAYAIRPYKRGCAPRPLSPHLSPIGAICGAYAFAPYKRGFAPHLFSPFLSLMKEKEAKENQGVRDASQIYRVRDVGWTYVPARWMGFDRAAYVLCPLTVLCDPLYKCAGRLWVLMGWGRGVMGRVWGLNGLHIIY